MKIRSKTSICNRSNADGPSGCSGIYMWRIKNQHMFPETCNTYNIDNELCFFIERHCMKLSK